MQRITVVIVDYHGNDFLIRALESVFQSIQNGFELEVIVVDNADSVETKNILSNTFPNVCYLTSSCNNFSSALNQAITATENDFIYFLNNDAVVEKNTLFEAWLFLDENPKYVGCGSKILYPDGRLQSCGHTLSKNIYWNERGNGQVDAGQYDDLVEVQSVSMAGAMFKRSALLNVGMFDERFEFYLEDVDMCLRLVAQGLLVGFASRSVVYHVAHGTMTLPEAKKYSERNRILLTIKHFPSDLEKVIETSEYFRVCDGKLMREIWSDFHFFSEAIFLYYEQSEAMEYHRKLVQVISRLSKQRDESFQKTLQNYRLEEKNVKQDLKNLLGSRIFRYGFKPLRNLKKILFRSAIDVPAPHFSVRLPDVEDEGSNSITIATIVSENYIPYARVLANSFLEKHVEGRVIVLVCTELKNATIDLSEECFEVVYLDVIKNKIPHFKPFCFQYDLLELNTAVKPFFLSYLLEEASLDKIIYLDPDIYVFDHFNPLWSELDTHSILLTPHIQEPYSDWQKTSEYEILRSGVYNLGFIGLSASNETNRFLEWWQERCYRDCIVDVEKGLFVDQRWVDLVPGLFESVAILKDPRLNVAYWNLHSYQHIRFEKNQAFLSNSLPILFFHFSGFDPEKPSLISKHHEKQYPQQKKSLNKLLSFYSCKLLEKGYKSYIKKPVAYQSFSNQINIPLALRRAYRGLSVERKLSFKDPFDSEFENSFFSYLSQPVDKGKPVVSRGLLWIYSFYDDLKRVFPDVLGADRIRYLKWVTSRDGKERGADVFNFSEMIEDAENKTEIKVEVKKILKRAIRRLLKNRYDLLSRLKRVVIAWEQTSNHLQLHNAYRKQSLFKSCLPFGIHFYGYATAEHGVGQAFRQNVLCADALNIPYDICDVSWHSVSQQQDLSLNCVKQSSKNKYRINFVHINADMVEQFFQEVGTNKFMEQYNIGFWAWETENFPDIWQEAFAYFDEIWVPSEFVKRTLEGKTSLPIRCFPHPLASRQITSQLRVKEWCNQNSFTFLFVFDFLSYFERKNPLAIVEAFKQAFVADDSVRLIIKTQNGSCNQEALKNLKKSIESSSVILIDETWNRLEVDALIESCDCYVSLHRSEGFGLTLVEAMSFGKPVIATGYSGNRDFMNEENSFLVNFQKVEIQNAVGPYEKGDVWAEPDISHAAELMRFVYENHERAKEIGVRAKEDVQVILGLEASRLRMQQYLNQIDLDTSDKGKNFLIKGSMVSGVKLS